MAKQMHFETILHRLLDKWVSGLKKRVYGRYGRTPWGLLRNERDKKIQEIWKSAEKSIVRSKKFQRELGNKYRYFSFRVSRKRSEKWQSFQEKFEKKRIKTKSFVYAFWKGWECLKVGQTNGRGIRRIYEPDNRPHFKKATRIEIYTPKWRASRVVSSLECELTHWLNPTHNIMRPPDKKHQAKCSVHEVLNEIWYTCMELFKFKSR